MDLPVDLLQLAAWVLHDPLCLSFVQAVTNDFFMLGGNPGEDHFVRVRDDERGCWNVLPKDWQAYFETVPEEVWAGLLRDLGNGAVKDDFPPSLANYIKTCTSLSLNRTCSTLPILSHPPRPPKPAGGTGAGVKFGWKHSSGKLMNAERAGLSPKKQHEVVQFGALVGSMLGDLNPPTHAVDVGSGRAHLSRALAAPPLSLHVLAVDWSATQTSGAKYLDSLKTLLASSSDTGSLTHRTSSLDAESIETVLQEWPAKVEEGNPSLLVALHACGDLTPDSLKAFVEAERAVMGTERAGKRKAVCVGCCYNLMTPSKFPISKLVTDLPLSHLTMTQEHLHITPQAPATWHLSPQATKAISTSITKLAHRARMEVELELHNHGGERRIGRVPLCPSYEAYRKVAWGKYGENWEMPPFPGWDKAVYQLQVFWTLRSLLGPAIESLLLLDRFAFVVEGMEGIMAEDDRRSVQLVNIFEQSTGSLRNVALVIR